MRSRSRDYFAVSAHLRVGRRVVPMAKIRGLTREGLKEKWLDESLAAMKSYMGASIPLVDFMIEFNDKGRLSRSDRLLLVEQALILFEMNYVHLPQKRAMHGT